MVVFLVLLEKSSSFCIYSGLLTKLKPLFRYTSQIYRGIRRSRIIGVFSHLLVRFYVKKLKEPEKKTEITRAMETYAKLDSRLTKCKVHFKTAL